MRGQNFEIRDRIEDELKRNGIEFRRGLSGGGNQLRQPYIVNDMGFTGHNTFKHVEHIHNFSWYVGNYPSLEIEKIDSLIGVLNGIK